MEFNINRVMRLMKRDAIVYRKPIVLGVAAVFIVLMLLMVSYAYDGGFVPEFFLVTRFNFSLLVGGLLMTTIIFWEFKSAAGRVHFLGIPASTLEKLVTRWLYTFLLFPLLCLIIFFLVFLVSSAFLEYNGNDEVFEVLSDSLMAYWIVHPIVFMFGIWYNRYVAPKIIVSALLFCLGAVAVFFVMHRMFFNELYSGFALAEGLTVDPDPTFQIKVEGAMVNVARFVGLVFVPIFFTVVSYFKLREKQA